MQCREEPRESVDARRACGATRCSTAREVAIRQVCQFQMMLMMKFTQVRPIAGVLCAAVFAFAAVAGNEARAQSAFSGVPNAMQGFSQNRDQPIQIEAAALEMRD